MFGMLALVSNAMAAEIHVAPDGSDSNDGSKHAPLATIAAARDALRVSRKLGKETCTVTLADGIYYLPETLVLTPEDSGSEKHPVFYRAENRGGAVLSGGLKLDLDWRPYRNGIFQAKTPADLDIDQLFIDGINQPMARYPNYDAAKKTDAYQGYAADAFSKQHAANWSDPSGGYIHAMHRSRWGGYHYLITGKNAKGEVTYEGGWQNNRQMGMHASQRMVENVFEELDTPGEWFHDADSSTLYYLPAASTDLATAVVEVVRLRHLVEIYGDQKQPVATIRIPGPGNQIPDLMLEMPETVKAVQWIELEGLRFRGARRTFMDTREPLLQSDWAIYRGGAVHLRGTEHIVIENCDFEELGGNAVFVDGYNRHAVIRGNLFKNNGASDVNFVGSFAAVRSPRFSYLTMPHPLDSVDREIGPKTDEYPADCLVEDNLMMRCGRIEKQSAGVNVSMSSRIKVRHNTVFDTPRAAINICDGTWGGHVIEWNDCFETVLETHDHGAFNSWGRDRYWHQAGPSGPKHKDKSGKPLISYWIEDDPNSPFWDAYQTTTLRHNRMQCDHGWDIDLDDGSTNYEIYNNVCLSGGLKTREGYKRIVGNNVVLGKGYTCNVPYPKPTLDVFEYNILWGEGYSASNSKLWGGSRNKNLMHNPASEGAAPWVRAQIRTGDDSDSLYGNAQFVNPGAGDFSVADDSPALALGFKNFPMKGFGVVSARLKAMVDEPPIVLPGHVDNNEAAVRTNLKVLGAEYKSLDTQAELTATGMDSLRGVLLVDVETSSLMAQYGFESDDVVLEIDGQRVAHTRFARTIKRLSEGKHQVAVWRGQQLHRFEFKVGKISP
ncbi:right-handed parallel beta-helix repeat-containing protein [Aporhodopirellula aestuarii]|uniref:Signaling protein n=1 Tax=Aporhodopirellula aestuarii TaxID=2950107 RepID=A0ABT0U7G8_9BACT|nr:right-handed parallel beta-helix repeat-containing protein [Aporhodopirellula aestuarii]MCM2372843.1 signaling protein [Aporhodopirellula aestuarii]